MNATSKIIIRQQYHRGSKETLRWVLIQTVEFFSKESDSKPYYETYYENYVS